MQIPQFQTSQPYVAHRGSGILHEGWHNGAGFMMAPSGAVNQGTNMIHMGITPLQLPAQQMQTGILRPDAAPFVSSVMQNGWQSVSSPIFSGGGILTSTSGEQHGSKPANQTVPQVEGALSTSVPPRSTATANQDVPDPKQSTAVTATSVTKTKNAPSNSTEIEALPVDGSMAAKMKARAAKFGLAMPADNPIPVGANNTSNKSGKTPIQNGAPKGAPHSPLTLPASTADVSMNEHYNQKAGVSSRGRGARGSRGRGRGRGNK